jgi:hypothetical protein
MEKTFSEDSTIQKLSTIQVSNTRRGQIEILIDILTWASTSSRSKGVTKTHLAYASGLNFRSCANGNPPTPQEIQVSVSGFGQAAYDKQGVYDCGSYNTADCDFVPISPTISPQSATLTQPNSPSNPSVSNTYVPFTATWTLPPSTVDNPIIFLVTNYTITPSG